MLSAQTPDPLLPKIVPNPTGNNAYEDYLRAGDLVGPSLWNRYDSWIAYRMRALMDPPGDPEPPEIPPGVSPGMTDLTIRRVANERLGGVMDIIRNGNEKPSFDPRSSYDANTLLPEFARFKMLAKVDLNRAQVEFADGHTRQAAEDLLDGMTFSHKILGSTMISALVSVAIQAIMTAGFSAHLGQLTLDDAKMIEKRCKSLLEVRLPIGNVFRTEASINVSALDTYLDDPQGILSDDEYKALGPAFKALGPAERQQIKDMFSQGLAQRCSEEEARFNGPESGWLLRDWDHDPVPNLGDKSVSNLVLVLLNNIEGKDTHRQFSNAVAKSRVQLKLLLLHAKVIQYHWQNGLWPTKIEDFADTKTAMDPFEGKPFHYELKDNGYRLYSMGIPGIGPVELKYHSIGNLKAVDSGNP